MEFVRGKAKKELKQKQINLICWIKYCQWLGSENGDPHHSKMNNEK